MKKLLSLLLALAVLTAMCACAEKMKEITPDEAAALSDSDQFIAAFLIGSYNISGGDIVTENGIEYAAADDLNYAAWDSFTAKLREVYTDDAVGMILSSGSCMEKDGKTYLKYIAPDGDYGYSVVSMGEVMIDSTSDGSTAKGVREISSAAGGISSVSISYENTPDGWRISSPSAAR